MTLILPRLDHDSELYLPMLAKKVEMVKFAVILLSLLLQSCSTYSSKQGTNKDDYFSVASSCFRSSERKVYVKVPTAGTMTVIEVPVGNDANVFGSCMEHSGHPVTQANPEDYLNVSRACMQEARDSSSPNDTYAKCVRHGKITVETMPPDVSK